MTDSGCTVCFVVSALYEVAICDRFRPSLARQGWRIVIVTHVFSAWLHAKQRGIPAVLSPVSTPDRCPLIDTECSVERRLGQVSEQEARRFQHSLWAALEACLDAYAPQGVILWNGQGLSGGVATRFARDRGLATVYFELGNIEPKLFADRRGVNAAAEIAAHPELLEQYAVSDEEIDAWKVALVERRSRSQRLAQAAGLLKLNPWFLVDLAYRLVTGAPQPRRLSVLERLREKLRLGAAQPPPPIRPDKPYLFFPLQVSRDSNLLMFSQHDNFSALTIAANSAERLGVQLVIKPHPAETRAEVLERIKLLCAENNWLLTSHNTTQLVMGAEAVITINSTVGMEAKLLGKPVEILGQSLYGAMSPRQIAVLAMKRLIDFSPFGEDAATDKAADQLLALLTVSPAASVQSASELICGAK